MRVVMLTWHSVELGVGGVQGHVHFLSEALQRAGHEVRVVVLQDFVRPRGRLRAGMLRLTKRLVGDTLGDLLARIEESVRLRVRYRAVRAEIGDADVAHFHDFIRIRPLAARLRRETTVVWTNHLGEFLRIAALPAGRRLTRGLTGAFDRAIGPSNDLADQRYITPSSRYIPNGVDVARFFPVDDAARAAARTQLGLGSGLVVLVPRRWAPTKGVLEAAQAVHLFDPQQVSFVFLGSEGARDYPDYGRSIEAELRGRPDVTVRSSVRYDDMPRWLHAADMVLIPSALEATSLSALEAMACGTPVVASDTGGLAQLITDGETGYLLTQRDAVGIAHTIRRVRESRPDDVRRVRDAAASLAVSEYSWPAVAERTTAVYTEAVEAASASRAGGAE